MRPNIKELLNILDDWLIKGLYNDKPDSTTNIDPIDDDWPNEPHLDPPELNDLGGGDEPEPF